MEIASSEYLPLSKTRKMLNVLWLVSWYPNRTDAFIGDFIERHAIAVSSFAKLTVLFIGKDECISDNSFELEIKVNQNLTVYRVYYGRSGFNGPLEQLLSLRKFRMLQKEIFWKIKEECGMPEIVHVHVAMKAGMLARWLKRKFDVPYVITEHWTGYYPESEPNIFNSNSLLKKINKAVLKDAAMFLPVSSDLGKVVNQYFTPIQYTAIPNVVNMDLFFYQPLPNRKFRFIHPSYLNHQKNPEGILLACKILFERGYDFELVLIGNMDENLVKLAGRYGLNEVLIFKGSISYEMVAKEMQLSSSLLLFSRFENLPCVILEALCCGLPVISSRVGGIPEVIDGENGILVESGNIPDLVTAMIQMIENYAEYNRKLIAEKAIAFFNYNTVGKQYSDIYNTVLKR
jgi:glycosyltransferase involved in cell wall biosynthesis